MTRRLIPQGGYWTETGRVLTRAEVTRAVNRYARKYGWFAATVRSMTDLKRKAIKEWCDANPTSP